jgi:carboxymethylenebutenolidase
MKEQQISITLPGGHPMRARWLRPDTANPYQAGVIVIHDIFGYTEDIERIGRRLAAGAEPILSTASR